MYVCKIPGPYIIGPQEIAIVKIMTRGLGVYLSSTALAYHAWDPRFNP
jgi:hypothetical protein